MITDLITHLQTELIVTDGYAKVAHAWTTQPNDEISTADLPAALVFTGRDSSDESNADNRVDQRTNREVWIYTVCNTDDLDDLRQRLFDAALGWQADGSWDALQHERGEVRDISGHRIWWLDVFRTWRMNSQT